MDDIASECRTHRHHPEWSNVYNRVFVRWTTHNPPGLSEKDTLMARLCDSFASREQSQESADSAEQEPGTLEKIVAQAKGHSDDCCGGPIPQQKEKENIESEEAPAGAQGGLGGVGGQPT
ncbi:MAG: hypothetical protein M1828_004339 [Chrysothrix sp. TS-e1954]|nr:MAG: hypothetical protein M1828_004339 [Chrysothrix sp. TS-e1954]